MDILDFSNSYPFTRQVTDLMGAEGVTVFPDGDNQITSRTDDNIFIFSPKLPPDQLEDFCKKNLQVYEKMSEQFSDLINDCQDFQIEKFW